MSFEEALAVLAIDVRAGEDGARRAYLRLIKVHKPDRNPLEFRRVREAFERVKGEIGWRARLATPTDEAKIPSPSPEPLPEMEPRLDPEPPSQPPSQPPFQPPAEPQVDAEGEAPEPPAARAPAGLRRDEFPANPTRPIAIIPMELLKIREVPHPLRQFVARPGPALVVTERPALGVRMEPRSPAPPPMPSPAPEVAFDLSPLALMERACDRMGRGDRGGVTDGLVAFERAHLQPQAPEPDPARALHLVLLCFAGGHALEARKLFGALRTWFAETGGERRLMGGQQAARLAVARALVELPVDSPDYPIRVIAQATDQGTLEAAHPHLVAFARESPYSAGVAADHFDRHAPLLAGAFAASLRVGAAEQKRATIPEKKTSKWMMLLWFFLIFGTIRTVTTCNGTSTYHPPLSFTAPVIRFPELSRLSFPPIQVPRLELPKLEPLPVLESLEGMVSDLCDDARKLRDREVCRLAKSAVRATQKRDCAALERALLRMNRINGKSPPPPKVSPLGMALRSACALPADVVDPQPVPEQNQPIETPREAE